MTLDPPPRISESAALAVAEERIGTQKLGTQQLENSGDQLRVLCTSIGRGQAGRGIWRKFPAATVTLCYIDQFQQRQALEAHAEEVANVSPGDRRLEVVCRPDFPDQTFDLGIVPCSIRGEAELHRDYLQQAYLQLRDNGILVSSVDNPKDKWLHEQMQQFETKVTAIRTDTAAVYVISKDKPLRRERAFDADFSFRDRGETIHAITRPGVFSHRHLDSGAAALIDAAEVLSGERVVDFGCGSGVVSLALAKRQPTATVLAIDSNARAVQCTERGAAKNELKNVSTHLTCDGETGSPGGFDVSLCNPPYFANFQIAALFVEASRRALKPGGRIFVVTKRGQWYQENMYPGWRDITVTKSKQYEIVTAIRG